jgi:hypothetical protein
LDGPKPHYCIIQVSDERAKARAIHDVTDIAKGLVAIDTFLKDTVKLHGKTTQCNEFISKLKSETNAAIKRAQPFTPKEKRKAPEDWRIASVLKEMKTPSKKKPKKSPVETPAAGSLASLLLEWKAPKNGTHYDLHELVTYMLDDHSSPIFQKSVPSVHDSLKGAKMIICGRSTLQRHCTMYRENHVLPRKGWDAVATGRPPHVPAELIPSLNDFVVQNVGVVAGSQQIHAAIQSHIDRDRMERNLPPRLSPTPITRGCLKNYEAQAASQPGVALVKASSARTQGAR